MKPLKRPMFRYGGPIKEGIMHGMREPLKNGGLSKQFNTGLVGDDIDILKQVVENTMLHFLHH